MSVVPMCQLKWDVLKKKNIQQQYDREMRAEMEQRCIKYPKYKNGKSKSFKKLTLKEKRDLLVQDEIRVLAADGNARAGIESHNLKYTKCLNRKK